MNTVFESNFSWWLDGSIVGLYLIGVIFAGLWMRRFVSKVDDFLVAGREMKLYLGIASLAATEFGIVTCMYTAQNGYLYGFAGATPGILMALAMLVVGLTGFCIKPLRDAGVVTLPELFQQQFGPRIRCAAGVVIVMGGLLTTGVFLRLGGEFLVGAAGLAEGRLEITMTFLLLIVLVYTILGGMLSVLVTDFIQFVVMSVGLLLVTVLILIRIGWSELVQTVQAHHGSGGFNPFVHEGLGWSYVIFFSLIALSGVLTWQPIVQRVLSAKDTSTGRRVYSATSFFFVCRFVIPGIWGIAALALLPELNGNDTIHAMPKFLAVFVPIGVIGILIAAMLAADMSTNSSYILSWTSVIYNDIIAPFRKGRSSESQGILWNRLIVAVIGLFMLFFGLWYEFKTDIVDYLGIASTVYLSSMSTLLIAACYWPRANDWGAAGALGVGVVIPVTYLILEQTPETSEWVIRNIGPRYSGIATYALAALAMVIGSLMKPSVRVPVAPITLDDAGAR